MSLYRIDPLHDCRWQRFLLKHPSASIFHTSAWLDALSRTYGYEVFALTTCAPDRELVNGLVLCRINSRLTGRRLVSLPFSDHCEPLVDGPEALEHMLCSLERDVEKENLRYVEIRPISPRFSSRENFGNAGRFWFHRIDLRPSLHELLCSFHKDCVQRKLQRALREALTYEEGRSEFQLAKFYRLLLLTRRRQQLPPHPLAWYRNLIECLGDKVTIRLACKDGQPIAGILTLRYKDVLVYKYGCSDATRHRLGGMQALFWRAIEKAKLDGVREFDLGRSDYDNTGLASFKDRWGATRSTLNYWRYPAHVRPGHCKQGRITKLAKQMLAHIPNSCLTAAGSLLYKHMG